MGEIFDTTFYSHLKSDLYIRKMKDYIEGAFAIILHFHSNKIAFSRKTQRRYHKGPRSVGVFMSRKIISSIRGK